MNVSNDQRFVFPIVTYFSKDWFLCFNSLAWEEGGTTFKESLFS